MDVCFLCLRVRFLLLPPLGPPGLSLLFAESLRPKPGFMFFAGGVASHTGSGADADADADADAGAGVG
jgi:hypothetical protein